MTTVGPGRQHTGHPSLERHPQDGHACVCSQAGLRLVHAPLVQGVRHRLGVVGQLGQLPFEELRIDGDDGDDGVQLTRYETFPMSICTTPVRSSG
jgi:hypothetical protein